MEFLFLVCLMKFSIASELSYLYCTEGLNMRRCDPSFHVTKGYRSDQTPTRHIRHHIYKL